MNDIPEEQLTKFIDEFRKTVVVPDTKGKKFLLCPIGILGSGKTTVMKPLAEKLGLVRLSSDEVRKMLKERGFNYQQTERIAFVLADDFLMQGYGIAIDADCARQEKQEQVKERAAKDGIPVIWIHINPPEEFILNKLRHYPHSWLFKDAEAAIRNYEARKPLHQDLQLDFAYTFDPSRPDLDAQIDEAAEIITRAVEK